MDKIESLEPGGFPYGSLVKRWQLVLAIEDLVDLRLLFSPIIQVLP